MAGRPRLLVLITLAETGGAQTFVRSLVGGLRDRYSIDVAAHGADGALSAACRDMDVPFHHVRNLVRKPHLVRDPRAVFEVRSLVRKLAPDIVQINSSKAGTIARLALAGTGIPTVFTAHGWAFAARRGLKGRLTFAADRMVAPLTSAIVCVSDFDRSIAVRQGVAPDERLHRIHNGVEVPETAIERGPWPAHPLLITATRLVPQKDVALLIEALATPELGSYRLDVLGEGPEREHLLTLRDRLGLSDRVRILGDRDDVAQQLAKADAFVLPTKWEGLPYSILEAMGAGLPVVASRVGGIPEQIVDGETGYLVEPRDRGSLVAALTNLSRDGERARAMGRAAHQRAKQLFSLDTMVQAYDTLFRSLLTTKAAASASTSHAYR